MSSKRYRKRAGEPVTRTPQPAGAAWLRRMRVKGSKSLWLYALPFAVIILLAAQHLVHEALLDIVAYAPSTDGSVEAWAEQLRAAGFHVHVEITDDPERVRRQLGVPRELAACHTAITVQGRYVLEGNVPSANIEALLASRSDIRGLAAPQNPSQPFQDTVRIVKIKREL